MSGFLLDTDVVSMLSPSRADASSGFVGWLERMDHEGRVFLSVVTIHEIEKGISLLEQKHAVARAAALRVWLSGLMTTYADKILVCDAESAVLSGRLEAVAVSKGAGPGMADAMIAGIAKTHELTVVTRNAKHFLPMGVPVLSPEAVCG